MHEETRMIKIILSHWTANRPQMVEDLVKAKQLLQVLEAAEQNTADILYQLISVRKLSYHQAWEIAMQEWALPSTEDHPSLQSTSNPNQGRAETSE